MVVEEGVAVKVSIDKLSNGTVWTFRPTSKGATRLMRKLFKGALWSGNGDRMMVEHRYSVDVAQTLVEHGCALVRDSDAAEIRVVAGRFVLADVLNAALDDVLKEDPS